MGDIQWFLGFIMIMAIMAYSGWTSSKRTPPPQPTPARQELRESAKQKPPAEKDIETVIRDARAQVEKLQEEVRAVQERQNASPLQDKLLIGSISRNSRAEYIVLTVPNDAAESILLSGMRLEARKGRLGAVVPLAWRLPFLGARGDGEPVVLLPGGRAYIITGNSANGMSFQLNTCTGFFEQRLNFAPSLPLQCPRATNEPMPTAPNELSEACLDFIERIPQCGVPGSIPLSLQRDGSCQAYLTKNPSYEQCVVNHKNDENFYKNDWRIYLGRDTNLWAFPHDTIDLFDQNGKLIDSKAY